LAGCKTLEELQNELLEKGVDAELVDDWKKTEEAELGEACGQVVDPQIRSLALQVIGDLAGLRDLGFATVCAAVLAFDVFCLRAIEPDKVAPQQLMLTCVAIVRLVEKSCRGTTSRIPWCRDTQLIIFTLVERLRDALPSSTAVAEELQSGTDMDNNALLMREVEVLKVCGMRLTRRPSLYDWASTIGTRFDVLTHGKLAAQLEWVWKSCMRGTQVLLWGHPVSQELAPWRIATGLFALGLAWVGVLPLNILKAEDVTESEWAQTLSKFPLHREYGMPACRVPQAYWQPLLQILQTACRCSKGELQAHISAVATAFATVSEESMSILTDAPRKDDNEMHAQI
jgi:hypothetical protein